MVVGEDLVIVGDLTREAGHKGAQVLAERGVDGIFAANDEMAVGVMWALANAGVRIPHDVALVGASYGVTNRMLGTVSLLGPLRMDYATAIHSVRGAAFALSRFVSHIYTDD